jgi:hypothetical protein
LRDEDNDDEDKDFEEDRGMEISRTTRKIRWAEVVGG